MRGSQLAVAEVLPATAWRVGQASDFDPAAFSRLVASIYDAALTPDLWPSVLDKSRAFVGGMASGLYAKDLSGLAGGTFYLDGNIEDRWCQLYFERYARIDPLNGGHLLTPIDVPVSNADLIDLDELNQSRYHREWAAPQGMADLVAVPLEKKGSWAALFGVFRHERDGLADDATKERMALLAPHMRRAVLIGKVIENGNLMAANLGEAVDGLASGVFLVDATGRIIHSNDAGKAMLGVGAIEMLGGRLVANDYEANRELTEVFAASGQAEKAMAQSGLSIALPAEKGDDHVAHVLPLTARARLRFGMQQVAVAAVFVRRVSVHVPGAPEVLAKTYGLTLSELKVLNAIVQVGGVPETAEELGLAETTVKTHLHRVFAKTGTSRQADLVRLTAGFASPLAR